MFAKPGKAAKPATKKMAGADVTKADKAAETQRQACYYQSNLTCPVPLLTLEQLPTGQ